MKTFRNAIRSLCLLLALTPVIASAQTPNFPQTLPQNSVVGRLGNGPGPAQAIPFSVLGPRLAPFLNVVGLRAENFGVKCDGITDNTVSLNTFFAALGNGSGVGGNNGILPAGFCNFTSALSIPVRNDFQLSGQGPATTLRYVGTNPTINLIVIGNGTDPVSRFILRDFKIDSTTTMSAGSAVWLRRGGNYTFDGVNCGQQFSTNKLWNCLWADSSSFGSVINATMGAQQDTIRVNNGVELNIDNVFMLNGGDTAIHVGGGFGGLYTGYVSIFGQAVGLRVDTTITAASNSQLFVSNRTVMDNNSSAGVYLSDSIAGNKSFSFQGWCSSATVSAQGCFVINAFANGNIQMGGGAQFLSNANSAILYSDVTVNLTLDPSTVLEASGAYGINCSVSATKVRSYAQPVLPNGIGMYSANCNVPTLTANGIMIGNGPTGQPSVVGPLTNGQFLTGVTGSAPAAVASTGTGLVVLANNPGLVAPNLGTPSAVTLTNGTGLPISTGVSGLGAGAATFLATPSSANLRAAVTDETGSGGALVFANNPGFAGLSSSGDVSITSATSTALQITGSSANSIGFHINNTAASGHDFLFFSSGGGPGPVGTFGIYDNTSSAVRLSIGPTGGLFTAGATGGDKGAGTINAAGAYYANGTVGISCPSGINAGTFRSVNGIVTAC